MQKEETVQTIVKLKQNTQNPMLSSDIKANTKTTLKVEAILKVEGFSYKAWQEKNPAGLQGTSVCASQKKEAVNKGKMKG